jgi:hypothetical protein
VLPDSTGLREVDQVSIKVRDRTLRATVMKWFVAIHAPSPLLVKTVKGRSLFYPCPDQSER